MSNIFEYVDQIQDVRLRENIRQLATDLSGDRRFGLRFETHLQENVVLAGVRPRRGDRVVVRGGDVSSPATLRSVTDNVAVVERDGESSEVAIADLQVVRLCGEAVFPRLKPVEQVGAKPSKRSHVLIEGENYHALELLNWTHAGKVDCIYIDPPYNTGATSWLYNNKFVDQRDAHRSSKWLSMMARRLRLAGGLLRDDGVLIVTIDENELARLRLLLDDDPRLGGWDKHVVTIEHNPRGIQGDNFSVTNEFAIFVTPPGRRVIERRRLQAGEEIAQPLRKWGAESERSTARNCFYPIRFKDGAFVSAGEVLPDGLSPPSRTVELDDGVTEYWPIDAGGTERKWRYARNTIDEICDRLTLRSTRAGSDVFLVNDTRAQKTVWKGSRYAAFSHGTKLVNDIAGRKFPFPKSLYATYDCVEAVCRNRPDAIVLDFFGGSGTTLHAVALLNETDAGNRTCITVTNNEVGTAEAKRMSRAGLAPGDEEWDEQGICRSITFPRLRNAVTGRGSEGRPLAGAWATGRTRTEEVAVAIRPFTFFDRRKLASRAAREQFLAEVGARGAATRAAAPFHVPGEGEGEAAYLFEPDALEPFLAALREAADAGQTISRVLHVAPDVAAEAKSLADALRAGMPLSSRTVEDTRPFAAGLDASLSYFRLEYLDQAALEAGRRLRELLPTLWLNGGAIGLLPEIGHEPWIVPEGCRFGLLVEPSAFAAFAQAIEARPDVDVVYIVADDDTHFNDMVTRLPSTIDAGAARRLYRSYLSNFPVNTS